VTLEENYQGYVVEGIAPLTTSVKEFKDLL